MCKKDKPPKATPSKKGNPLSSPACYMHEFPEYFEGDAENAEDVNEAEAEVEPEAEDTPPPTPKP